jgi:hypothetical protein
MKLREHAGAREFLAAAAPVLEADEARHNLGYGICSTLIESPGTYPRFHLWTVEADEGVAGAAMMTPPHNLWLARPADSAVLELLARELAARGIGLPGVTAAQPEVDAFAAEWQRRHAYQGKPVRLLLPDGESVKGTVAGVDSTGALVLADGPRRARFLAGEISLRRA